MHLFLNKYGFSIIDTWTLSKVRLNDRCDRNLGKLPSIFPFDSKMKKTINYRKRPNARYCGGPI